MAVAITIAGSDPSGGAGLQADLKTFAAHGVYGLSVTTAVTVQSTVGVGHVHPLAADLVSAQLETLAGDFAIDAVKLGMLANDAIVEAVAAAIVSLDLPKVIVDPVMLSSSGARLLDADGVSTLERELLPHAFVVTPNVPEAERLARSTIRSLSDVKRAAEAIHRLRPHAVLIKGGHLEGNEAIDVLFDGDEMREFRAPRIAGAAAHGTGCAFSAALAASLALGHSLVDSVDRAKQYVTGALEHRLTLGQGAALLNHFWALY
ncbi:MAG TPA: bifunctional hydroxymethylpyrimidine kinase/phosphomethylpyrimidine kinase [Vicinamibacterales bacterium]|jgi:hydroxymethylpyrimidine/phosphomethylpyrimidine kinase